MKTPNLHTWFLPGKSPLACLSTVPQPSTDPNKLRLLFVHGMWQTGIHYTPWLTLCQRSDIEAHALHFRGREGSRPVENIGAVPLHEFVADLLEAIACLAPVSVVGSSLGGLITLAALPKAKTGQVESATILCSSPPRGISLPFASKWRLLRLSYLSAMYGSKPFVLKKKDLSFLASGRELVEEAPPFVPESGRAIRELDQGELKLHPCGTTCRIRFFAGCHDRVVPPSVQMKIAALYGASPTVLQTGHMAHLERDTHESTLRTVIDRIQGSRRKRRRTRFSSELSGVQVTA
ncbi:MAG: hypothetical protein A2849_00750 [Candidatus Taylorbacteria bacterium RIFCSPHIGHO2_01_FULL_51_15]|uniref:AB hydrolase-1 domain-containing protein n=1 Tax=Candidatus Taylorbacteria bacterium RIFCSPHIGHO2_01_FULL_51_15 TaxID=1802304 RepID=A0A1G2M9D5_9BACT|nr:MAG: hypothetical protein A2849_00750 [Candidatus Taylorbacteria bacterium RIFCSPHIGHO2_01_FULL_51_15]